MTAYDDFFNDSTNRVCIMILLAKHKTEFNKLKRDYQTVTETILNDFMKENDDRKE